MILAGMSQCGYVCGRYNLFFLVLVSFSIYRLFFKVALGRHEFDFYLHAHSICETFKRPNGRVSVTVLKFADVRLSNASFLRELFLSEAGKFASVF